MSVRQGVPAPALRDVAPDSAEEVPSADQLRAAAVQGVRTSSIARPLSEALLFGSMVVLSRLIAPAEFGRYAIALIVQELASVIASEGVGGALVQRRSCRREHLQSGMALSLLIGIGLGALVLGASGLLVAPIFGERTALFVRLMAPLCLIAAAGTVPVAVLRRRMAFRRLAEIEVLSTLVRAGVCVALALSGLGGESLVFGTLAAGFAISTVAWCSAPPPPPRLHRREVRELLGFGLPASLAGVSWVGFRNSDYAIVGARLGALQAGLYFRAYTLAVDYQKKVSVVMSQVGFPLLSRTRSSAEMAEVRRQMVSLLTVVLFPLLSLLAITTPLVVPFLFGAQWNGMIVPAQILVLGGAATLVIDATAPVMLADGRTRAILGYGVAHWLVYALTAFAVSPLGIVAVAIDAALVHTAFLFVAYALMLHGSGQRPLRRLMDDILPATVSCIGLAAIVVPASLLIARSGAPALLQLAALAVLAAASYLITLRVCFPETSRSLLAIVSQVLPERRGLRWAKRRLAPTVGAVPPVVE